MAKKRTKKTSRVRAKRPSDREEIWFIAKVFSVMVAVFMCVYLIATSIERYSRTTQAIKEQQEFMYAMSHYISLLQKKEILPLPENIDSTDKNGASMRTGATR